MPWGGHEVAARSSQGQTDCAASDQRAFTATGAVGAVGGQFDEESGMVRLTRTEHASNTRSVEAQVGSIVHAALHCSAAFSMSGEGGVATATQVRFHGKF